MIALLAGAFRWVLRNLASLVVILLVLYFGNVLLREWRESAAQVATARSALQGLEGSAAELQRVAGEQALAFNQRLQALRRQPDAVLDTRRSAIESEIATRKAARRGRMEQGISLATGDHAAIVADQQRELAIRLLELERDSLDVLRHGRVLEELRSRHAQAYARLKAESAPQDRPTCPVDPDSWAAKLPTIFSTRAGQHLFLCAQNARAWQDYSEQKARYEALARPRSAIDAAREVVGPVEAELERARAVSTRASLGVMLHDIAAYLPAALAILAGILLAPVAIKAFLYYVVAPFAARRPPIRLLPAAAAPASRDSGPVSSVSKAIGVDAGHELLVHSDYLQSSATASGKDTKWLLDVRYPLASVAAGMTVLTRIRPARAESVVLSSTRDPFSEVGVLTLQEGEAIVLQPHCLVGVLQPRNRPVRITSHWRLGSLSAWLTLQLRYLVFHGPGSLIVRGCRGVRVESADAGRLINQAATMGFSANLEYSATRSETFAAYLLGKQELFNDRFSGHPGFYVYEEMPNFGRKPGITGRGLEGLLDSLLKVFGI